MQHELDWVALNPAAGLFFLPAGQSLHPGGQDKIVPELRAAMAYLGYLNVQPGLFTTGATPNAALYDAELVAAVKRFQLDAGLQDDGVVGAATRLALRAQDTDRSKMLQQSLAQSIPPTHGRYILVNIAAGLVYAMEDTKVALVTHAIVGKPTAQTPLFSTRIMAVTLNPYWIAPPSIVAKEFGGDGHVEKPGPANPLGKLRLDMPNRYEIFLHDTNQPRLFARDARYYSHGCVRTQGIKSLAEWLVGAANWQTAGAEGVLAGWKSKQIKLDQPVPIYILYLTATVGSTGSVLYHGDPYHFAVPPPPPPLPVTPVETGPAPSPIVRISAAQATIAPPPSAPPAKQLAAPAKAR